MNRGFIFEAFIALVGIGAAIAAVAILDHVLSSLALQ